MIGSDPVWRKILHHAVLLAGGVIFALPFVWLIGTSWKLDKEVQSEEITIFPRRPVPRDASPYIDDGQFPPVKRPTHRDIGRHRWDGWMRAALEEEIGRVVDDFRDDRMAALDPVVLRTELVEGIFHRLLRLLPDEAWDDEELTFRQRVRAALHPGLALDAFNQSYRCFALGKVMAKDTAYNIHDLTAGRPVESLWRVEAGPGQIGPGDESGRTVAVVHYDYTKTDADLVTLGAAFEAPFDLDRFKRLEISFRRDDTWHEVRVAVELGGRLLRSRSARYAGDDTWWDITLQEPSADDERLVPKHYVLLDEAATGPQYDHGPRRMVVHVELHRSSTPEAFWAKGTENYRKAFQEVPFWRYLKTSIFLVVVNVLGTLVSCSLVAYALARLRWPGRGLAFVLVLATLMIPPQVTMIPSFVIYRYLGWYNTLAPLWVPNCLAVNAFAVFLLRQAMKGIPRDLEDAARIDGCGYFRSWWHVAMPLMKPTLAAIAIFTFMFVWNDFMTPLIYVNDQRLYPLALGLFSFMAGRENQFTLIMAGSMIMTLPVIITFFFAQRHFIQGVTMTGVKG